MTDSVKAICQDRCSDTDPVICGTSPWQFLRNPICHGEQWQEPTLSYANPVVMARFQAFRCQSPSRISPARLLTQRLDVGSRGRFVGGLKVLASSWDFDASHRRDSPQLGRCEMLHVIDRFPESILHSATQMRLAAHTSLSSNCRRIICMGFRVCRS